MKTAKQYLEELIGTDEADIKAEANAGTPYQIYEDTFDDLVQLLETYAADYYKNKMNEY